MLPSISNLHMRTKRYNEIADVANEIVIRRCSKQIVSSPNPETSTVFIVPRILPEYPLYDYTICVAKLVTLLQKNNYRCTLTNSNTLYIDWSTHKRPEDPRRDDSVSAISKMIQRTFPGSKLEIVKS